MDKTQYKMDKRIKINFFFFNLLFPFFPLSSLHILRTKNICVVFFVLMLFDSEPKQYGFEKVLKYAIAFSGKKVNVVSEIS